MSRGLPSPEPWFGATLDPSLQEPLTGRSSGYPVDEQATYYRYPLRTAAANLQLIFFLRQT